MDPMDFNSRRTAKSGKGLRTVIAAGVAGLCLGAGSFVAVAADFTVREHLGHAWSNECITFALTPTQTAAAQQGKKLLGPGGKEVPCQLIETGPAARLAFQVELPPHATAEYSFSADPATVSSDLTTTDKGGLLRIGNSRIGIEVRKAPKPGEGPIARIRLGSGVWTGSSTLTGNGAVAAYTAEVVARGPVFAEIVCRTTFVDQGTWTLRFRVERAEPVVLVEEQFDAPTGGVFRVALGDQAFQPTHLMHRDSDVSSAVVLADPLADYLLEPWLHWNNPRQGNWIALFTPTPAALDKAGEATSLSTSAIPGRPGQAGMPDLLGSTSATPKDTRSDMLVVGLLRPSLWVDPRWKGRAEQAGPCVQAKVRDGVLTLDLPVRGGRRQWMLGALDKGGSVGILTQKNRRVAPPAQQLVIKHGDFPLNRVKDYVLDWDGDGDNHPRLYVRKQDLPVLRASLKSDPQELKRWTSEQPIDKYYLDGPIREFIASGDAQLGKLMAAKGAEYLQTCVDWYLKQDERLTPGAAPHMQTLILSTLNLLDPVLSTECVTPAQRRRLLAQIAFLGYVVNSPDYWSAERGYSSFANMAATVALFQTALGCMAPSHPRGREWAERGLSELRRELMAWSDEDGGWLEAPHYAMVSYDFILGGFTMAANAGFGEYVYDERMRQVAEWFAGISTPRDSRTGGFRHQPPIGNTYHGEPTGVYGLLAGIWKERDPAFAGRMQTMYAENGSFGGLGIGWNFPAMLGYRFLFSTHGVTPHPAAYGSAWFRKTGVVLRNTMQSDRETYLHLIAGSNHDHYDYDSGSIILYGKGRVLADDWGYIGRHADKWHSMLTSAAAGGGGSMIVEAFAPGVALDYVSGKKGAWQRQIAFVKDTDPRGPAFFVIRDTHAADSPALWRLWLTATAVKINDQGATVAGAEDVDMDIFFHEAAGLKLSTETGTQKVSCGYRNGKEGPLENTQIALLANLTGRGVIAALLYPRLRTEPTPKVTWSAGGSVVQVETASGSDCVFLATPPPYAETFDVRVPAPAQEYTSADGKVRFHGTAGAAQVRGKTVTLTLGAAGKVRFLEKELTGEKAASRRERL